MKRKQKAKSNVGWQRGWQGGEAGPTMVDSATGFIEAPQLVTVWLIDERGSSSQHVCLDGRGHS